MDLLFIMAVGIIIVSMSESANQMEPIKTRDAVAGALFLFIWAVDEKHGGNHLLLFCAAACFIIGVACMLKKDGMTPKKYEGTEWEPLLRKQRTRWFMLAGVIVLLLYLGIDRFPTAVMLGLCIALNVLLLGEGYRGRKLLKRIEQAEGEKPIPPLPTDSERRACTRSKIKGTLIILAGWIASVIYMLV